MSEDIKVLLDEAQKLADKGKLDKALELYEKIIHTVKTPCKERMYALNNASVLLISKPNPSRSDLIKAEGYAKEFYDLTVKLKDSEAYVVACSVLGTIKLMREDYSNAYRLLKESLQTLEILGIEDSCLPTVLNRLAEVCLARDQLVACEYYACRAEAIANKLNDKSELEISIKLRRLAISGHLVAYLKSFSFEGVVDAVISMLNDKKYLYDRVVCFTHDKIGCICGKDAKSKNKLFEIFRELVQWSGEGWSYYIFPKGIKEFVKSANTCKCNKWLSCKIKKLNSGRVVIIGKYKNTVKAVNIYYKNGSVVSYKNGILKEEKELFKQLFGD